MVREQPRPVGAALPIGSEPGYDSQAGSPAPATWRVLIADDHAPTRADVRRALEADQRFEVCSEAADSAGAIQGCLRDRPEICVLDVKMPGSGVAAAWEIAARLPDAKIVMLTVSAEDADLFGAIQAGADGYLLKTMNFALLPDALDGVLFGDAAMPGALVGRVLRRLRGREPRCRQPVTRGPAGRLTSREWEVLELLAQQRSTGEIARNLVIRPSSVRVHIAAIVRKLKVPDRAAAAELFRARSLS
jgi:DNA-binding NarL/FixJ family response regulator